MCLWKQFWEKVGQVFSLNTVLRCYSPRDFSFLINFSGWYNAYSPVLGTKKSLLLPNCNSSPDWLHLWQQMSRGSFWSVCEMFLIKKQFLKCTHKDCPVFLSCDCLRTPNFLLTFILFILFLCWSAFCHQLPIFSSFWIAGKGRSVRESAFQYSCSMAEIQFWRGDSSGQSMFSSMAAVIALTYENNSFPQ